MWRRIRQTIEEKQRYRKLKAQERALAARVHAECFPYLTTAEFGEWWERQRALSAIRHTFAFFGCPLDDFTDEEIEQGAHKTACALNSALPTAAEATASLRRVGAVLNRV